MSNSFLWGFFVGYLGCALSALILKYLIGG